MVSLYINNSDNLIESSYHNKFDHSIEYYKRRKERQRRTRTQTQEPENISIQIGNFSEFTKDTPLIRYLIDKRINFCKLSASVHIAAFVPVVLNTRCCFIWGGKWKSRYR
jgi:hypothetical protein